MKIFICLLFICYWANAAFAQDINKMSIAQLADSVRLHHKQGRYETSFVYAQKYLEEAKKTGVNEEYAKAIGFIATYYNTIGNYEMAKKNYLEAIEINKKVFGVNHPKYGEALADYATLLEETGDYIVAEQLLKQAIRIYDAAVSDTLLQQKYIIALTYLAEKQRKMGKNTDAEPLFIRVVALSTSIYGEMHEQTARCLSSLALFYFEMGDFDAAEQNYKQAINIKKTILGENNISYATSLNDFARFYQSTGNYTPAASLFQQAAQIYKDALGENHPYYATTLSNLAVLYRVSNKYPEAEALLKQALKIQKSSIGENHPDYARTLNNLAVLYSQTGKLAEAEQILKQVLTIKQASLGANHLLVATSMMALAMSYQRNNKIEEAILLYQQALKIRKAGLPDSHPEYVVALFNLAKAYRMKSDYDLALKYLNYSLLANCKTKDSLLINTDLAQFSQLEFYSPFKAVMGFYEYERLFSNLYTKSGDKKDLKTAYTAIKAAVQINDALRKSYHAENDKLNNITDFNNQVYRTIQLGIILDEKLEAELFTFAELNKSTVLTEVFKSDRARVLGDLPDSLAFYEITLHEKRKKLEKDEIEAKDDIARHAARTELNNLNIELDIFLKSIKGKYPKYHALKYANITAKTADIQELLDEKTLFLEYFIADTVVYLFALTKNTVEIFPISLRKGQLSEKVKDLREALTNYKNITENPHDAYDKYTKSAFWFYQELVFPALKNAPKDLQNLCIVADGELGHLPFEVFLSKSAEQKETPYATLSYLVKDYNISYNYSATLWKENIQKPKHENNGEIFAFAPDYQFKASAMRAPQLQNLRTSLIPLPAAEAEITTLSELFSGTFKKGKEANEAFFKNHANKYGIIHLAMHGLLNKRVPILSSLAFSEDNDSIQDNFLEAWEIAHLDLNTDLVVLSACETGYGNFEQGEGVISLARSFMYAGVPSLVVSLWQVNDYSTSLIMKIFYQNLSNGLSKDAALRQAKLEYLKAAEGIAAHPAFWSAFIQLGDNRAIEIKTKTNWLYWGIGGLCLLVLGLGIAKMNRRAGKQQV